MPEKENIIRIDNKKPTGKLRIGGKPPEELMEYLQPGTYCIKEITVKVQDTKDGRECTLIADVAEFKPEVTVKDEKTIKIPVVKPDAEGAKNDGE